MYGDQSGESVCGYWDSKVQTIIIPQASKSQL